MKVLPLIAVFCLSTLAGFLAVKNLTPSEAVISEIIPRPWPIVPTPTPTPPTPTPIPAVHIIPKQTHVFQTFNNCGPASLSMTLSYLGQTVSQQELGQQLRPYQNRQGDNDDKSVTLVELAREAERRGFKTYFRPNGSSQILKQVIATGTPVVIRTWLSEGEDIGHFRVIRGYDETTQEFVQDDSLQGADLRYTYDELDRIWQPFNAEYLIVISAEKQVQIESILGADLDASVAWQTTYNRLLASTQSNPEDIYGQFNLSSAAYEIGDFETSTKAFERVESRLPNRMLWYQIEPILAYFKQGKYQRVLDLTDSILTNGNRAFSELYDLRSQAYEHLNQPEKAAEERNKILLYNQNYRLELFQN